MHAPRLHDEIAAQVAQWPSDAPLIELVDVALAFGDKRVLDGVNLRILPGEITVIIGRSGSGKTVLLKVMLGLLRPDRGTVRLFGHDLGAATERERVELHKHTAMLFQSYALFDALSVEDNVEFPLLESIHVDKPDAERFAHELLDNLGLAGNEDILPGELSGGMRKRVSLARALVTRPKVVLFDEPTTGLDPLMIERVDELIELGQRQYGITSVVISHDLSSVERLADRVAFLHDGKIVFEGSFVELQQSELPAVRRMLDVARPRIEQRASPVESGPPVIEVFGVHKHFGAKHVLRGIDLRIDPHQITFLIGASGSGKSVLARHLMGLLQPDAGRIEVFGTDLASLDEQALTLLHRRFGLVFQQSGLLDWLSVAANIAFPLSERGVDKTEVRRRVDEIMTTLELHGLQHALPGELSAGERKRTALARALVTRPDILIYDEPTTGQDPLRAYEIDELIRTAQERFGITSIVISHDMTSTLRLAHRIAMLHGGQIVACGTPAELLASSDPHVQQFLRAAGVAQRS